MQDNYFIDVELDDSTLRQLLLILREADSKKVTWAKSIYDVFFGEIAGTDITVVIHTKNRQPEKLIITKGRLRTTVVYYVQLQPVRLQIQALMEQLYSRVIPNGHSMTYAIQDLIQELL